MLYVSWCILYVSYIYLKQRMEYIRIHTEYTTIHVSTPSHMARPVRLWDTPGYNGIQQDTSARAYPHRLHTWDTWGIHAAMMYPIVAGEIHAGYIQDTCWIQRSTRMKPQLWSQLGCLRCLNGQLARERCPRPHPRIHISSDTHSCHHLDPRLDL